MTTVPLTPFAGGTLVVPLVSTTVRTDAVVAASALDCECPVASYRKYEMSNVSPPDVKAGHVNPCADAENGQADNAMAGTPADAGRASTVLAPGTEPGRPIDIWERIAATSSVCCC